MSERVYIERYWRDAKPEDAIKEPPMVARFRDDPNDDWLIDLLCGHDTQRRYWFSSSDDISETMWWHCEVYDAPDPGEGWRLVDADREPPQDGDEVWSRGEGIWKPRLYPAEEFKAVNSYRRRIAPTVTYVPFTWEDREQLRGRWIGRDLIELQVTDLRHENGLYVNRIDADSLCKYWKFVDTKKPVGKEVTQ